MNPELVSVLLLTKDGAATLPRLLEGLAQQETDFPVEVVAVDSGSRDGTLDLLRQVDRLERIDPAAFGHGRTRNFGLSRCQGARVALLVQDAVPANTGWLRELVAPLDDPQVAATFARQLPRPDASVVTRLQLSGWVASRSAPHTCEPLDAAGFAALTPLQRLEACAFDNVSSCVRRDVWERIPFPDVPIAEDLAWARQVLLAGLRIAYAPQAQVIHSHDRSPLHELRRTAAVHRELYRWFGLRTVPSAPRLLTALGSAVARHLLRVAQGPRQRSLRSELGRGVAMGVAWPVGQYLGARAGRRRFPAAPLELD